MNAKSVPVTWPDVLAADQTLLREDLAAIDDVPEQVASVQRPWLASGEFGAPSLTLAQAAVVFGPDTCTTPLHTLVPLIDTVMPDFDNGITKANRVPAQQLLSFFNTAQCCGFALPAAAIAAERDWPEAIVSHAQLMSESERNTLALAMIVAERVELVPSVIGGGPLGGSFTPGDTFDFNVQGFVRYLAVARRDRASFTDAEPAWLNFVQRFPHKLAANTLDWADLLYAARIVMTLRDSQAVGTVAASLHQLVTSLS